MVQFRSIQSRQRNYLSEFDPPYREIYDAFVSDYSKPYLEEINQTMSMPKSIKTILRSLSNNNNQSNIPTPMKIGIWEVTNV